MTRITTIRRSDDWIALKDGDKAHWEAGKTQEAAVNALKKSFPELQDR